MYSVFFLCVRALPNAWLCDSPPFPVPPLPHPSPTPDRGVKRCDSLSVHWLAWLWCTRDSRFVPHLPPGGEGEWCSREWCWTLYRSLQVRHKAGHTLVQAALCCSDPSRVPSCSAGIGRSGTLCLVDVILARVREEMHNGHLWHRRCTYVPLISCICYVCTYVCACS